MKTPKFGFDSSFQLEILRFILQNSSGIEGLQYVKSSYFDLIDHAVIMSAIERSQKKFNRIPSEPVLRNLLKEMFYEKEFYEALTREDQKGVYDLVGDIFSRPSQDGDIVKEEIARFSSFVTLRDTIERHDLYDFNAYKDFASKVSRAIDIADPRLLDDKGIFFIEGIKDRQYGRAITDFVIPTPFPQLNRLTSAGGYPPGSIVVLLDKPKKSKTTFLVNVARKYLASKKRVLYIDMENGEGDVSIRLEQSIGGVDKKGIVKNTHDKQIQKILRRYKRLGGEVYIKRIPALSKSSDIQNIIDRVYREKGMLFDILIIDYIGLMGSLSGRTDDFGRISDAYIDIANLMLKNKFQHCWTAHHVVRSSHKRSSTRYFDEDIAKCIDIVRHAQTILGLNRTTVEEAHGIMRLEVVAQREGVPEGRAFFRAEVEHQRIDELTKKEVEDLQTAGILYDPNTVEEEPVSTKKRGDI